MVALERSAHVLARMHEELRSLPDSTRAAWLLERNRKAQAKVAEKLGTLRDKDHTQRTLGVK